MFLMREKPRIDVKKVIFVKGYTYMENASYHKKENLKEKREITYENCRGNNLTTVNNFIRSSIIFTICIIVYKKHCQLNRFN